MMAEGLYNQALEKMKNDNTTYTKVMGMNLLGRLLLKDKMREHEATRLLKSSE